MAKTKAKALEGMHGEPVVLAPLAVFQKWKKPGKDPKDFFGIVASGKGHVLVFHDPETSYAVVQGDDVILVQTIFDSPKLATHLTKLPTTGWKRATGTYKSDGDPHVLFHGGFSFAEQKDVELLDDMGASPPITIAIPKGDYALEIFGTWKPDAKSEYSLGRLTKIA